MQTINYVGYIRVSSAGQTDNNSFEVQTSDIKKFIGNHNLITIIAETASGAKADRKSIMRAVELCKANDYTLVVSNVDRLSRELSLVETIRNAGVKFVFANMPNANELTIDILLSFAKFERNKIVERTNAGKKATKEKYGTLHYKKGTAKTMTEEKREKAVQAVKDKAAQNPNNLVAKELVRLYNEKGMTPTEIMNRLNSKGIKTSKGLAFTNIIQVKRLLDKK
jgi:DNA invertase Pin-like site-specific DNA recombinase